MAQRHSASRGVVTFATLATLAMLVSLAAACTRGESTPIAGGTAADTIPFVRPRDIVSMGAFEERDINESSAVVRGARSPNVFWTLNDSGNNERLFAFDSMGADLGAIDVSDAKNRDWEALATGPCPEGRCLYVGDVGDNLAVHGSIRIWRLPEPTPPGDGEKVKAPAAQRLRAAYPGGARDVEAMWVDADTVVWLATKRPARREDGTPRPSLVYRLPPAAWQRDDIVEAELVDSLPLVPMRDERTWVTDAALSNPFGDATTDSLLAVRTYGFVMVFRTHGTSGRPGGLVARCDLSLLGDAGEGLTWLLDGRLYFSREGRRSPLRALRCP